MASNEVLHKVEEHGGLDEREAEIMDLLSWAWHLWCAYQIERGEVLCASAKFRFGINQCQLVLGRMVLNRLHPDFWLL